MRDHLAWYHKSKRATIIQEHEHGARFGSFASQVSFDGVDYHKLPNLGCSEGGVSIEILVDVLTTTNQPYPYISIAVLTLVIDHVGV